MWICACVGVIGDVLRDCGASSRGVRCQVPGLCHRYMSLLCHSCAAATTTFPGPCCAAGVLCCAAAAAVQGMMTAGWVLCLWTGECAAAHLPKLCMAQRGKAQPTVHSAAHTCGLVSLPGESRQRRPCHHQYLGVTLTLLLCPLPPLPLLLLLLCAGCCQVHVPCRCWAASTGLHPTSQAVCWWSTLSTVQEPFGRPLESTTAQPPSAQVGLNRLACALSSSSPVCLHFQQQQQQPSLSRSRPVTSTLPHPLCPYVLPSFVPTHTSTSSSPPIFVCVTPHLNPQIHNPGSKAGFPPP